MDSLEKQTKKLQLDLNWYQGWKEGVRIFLPAKLSDKLEKTGPPSDIVLYDNYTGRIV